MKEEMKKLLEEMYDMGRSAENCISLLQTALIYNSFTPLKDCALSVDAIKTAEPELTNKITALAKDVVEIKPYISVPVHLLRIAEGIEKIAEQIEKKIKDNVLFSDKAMTEITFLLQRLSDIVMPTTDIILARNIILRRYVQESEAGIIQKATEYATFHEERLIEGLCLPIASSIYINMLDAVKTIAWHSKEIATKLGV